MPIVVAVGGIIGGAVVGGATYKNYSDYSDYSDYSNYSNYSDYAERQARRRQEKKREIKEAEKELENFLNEDVKRFIERENINVNIPELKTGDNSSALSSSNIRSIFGVILEKGVLECDVNEIALEKMDSRVTECIEQQMGDAIEKGASDIKTEIKAIDQLLSKIKKIKKT
ncbi:MAG TPA: hypothetical protein VEG39_09445 [Clostridia bacterium]|nr:hypothetical protein [Clostridia bacterium]